MSKSFETRRRETLLALIGVTQPEGFSPALERIREIAEHEDSDASKLAEALQLDPGLTTRILRMANSSYYTFRRKKITSLNEAVVTLGFEAVRQMTLTSGIVNKLSKGEDIDREEDADEVDDEVKHVKIPEFPFERFWSHSIACGLGTTIIASDMNIPGSKDTFVTGFLHDIAKLVLWRYLPKRWGRVLNGIRNGIDALRAEKEEFGLTHADIGAWLLRMWRFPKEHFIAVGTHHQESGRLQNPLGKAIYKADMISGLVMETYPFSSRNRRVVETKLIKMNMNKHQIDRTVETITSRVKDIATDLDLPIVDSIADENKIKTEDVSSEAVD